MTAPPAYFVFGATGLCGGSFLNLVNKLTTVNKIVTLSRREPSVTGEKSPALETIVEKDTDKWSEIIKNLDVPEHSAMFSGFGTTAKAAGSSENFIKIDHGINLTAFTAAKESGKFDTAVLVSSVGANADSRFLYLNTKGKIEEDLKALKFKRTIILRPGPLVGDRPKSKGFMNDLSSKVGSWTKNTMIAPLLGSPISGDEVAKAGLYLSQQPIKEDGEVLIYTSKELVELVKENSL